jgi:hypothetical protein
MYLLFPTPNIQALLELLKQYSTALRPHTGAGVHAEGFAVKQSAKADAKATF